MARDDQVGGGQPEARHPAHGLRREQGVEDAREVFGRDAAARVADADDRRVALAPRLDADLAALFDRVRGVDEEVEPDLIQLPREAVDERQFAVGARERDVDVAEFAREQAQGRVESLVYVYLLELGLVEPREGAKVLHDVAYALSALAAVGDDGAQVCERVLVINRLLYLMRARVQLVGERHRFVEREQT